MENDIEQEFGELAARLRAVPSAHVGADFSAKVMSAIREERKRRRFSASGVFALAASFFAVVGFAAILSKDVPQFSLKTMLAAQQQDGSFAATTAAPYVQAFAVKVLASDPSAPSEALSKAVASLIRTQNADGGWGQPELSARNSAALRTAAQAGDEAAACAHRRALRYLRYNGIKEPSPAEFAHDARIIFERLSNTGNAPLLAPLALASNLN